MSDSDFYVKPVSLPDGRRVSVIPLTYGRARIVVGRDDLSYDDLW